MVGAHVHAYLGAGGNHSDWSVHVCMHTLVQEAQLQTWLLLSKRAFLSRVPKAVLNVCGGVLSA